jgi:alpha-L-rhamnosidase
MPLSFFALAPTLLAFLVAADPGPSLQSSFIWAPGSPPGTQAYVAFRAPPFLLDPQHTNTTIHLFADTRYQLYVNGQYILRGPCRFNPKRPEYDSLDLSPSLIPGQLNWVVVLVHHYGNVINGRIISHPPGLAVLVESGDSTVLLQTSTAWKSSASTQYLPSPGAWSSIPDVIDSRALVPLGDWTQPNYNDSSWAISTPVVGSLWGVLQPRYLPLPRESIVPGVTLLPSGAPLTFPIVLGVGQAITLNLGAMSMAYAVLALNASQAGSTVHVEFALRYVGGAMKETYGVGMTLTTQLGPQTFTGGDQWCAHYVSITAMSGGPVIITSLHFVARSYPFERAGSFNSSDPLLNEVWLRAANTLAVVTDDAYGSGGCPPYLP